MIEVLRGDITALEVDAIVNAANSGLLGGGGVDGAIHAAGGPEILMACQEIREQSGPCPTGEAVITTAGRLPAKYVIHAVGPVWKDGLQNESELLRNAYTNSLLLAKDQNLRSLAFPNISTGVYGFPKPRAAEIAIEAIRSFQDHSPFERIACVCFDEENFRLYEALLTHSNLS